jgi:hypothetical protein
MAMILRNGKAISQAPCTIGRSNSRLYSCLHPLVRLSQSLTHFSLDGFRVKDFFVHRTVRGLIIPLALVICVLLAGFGPAHAAKPGRVEVGFKGTPPPGFQNAFVNIIAVRINPKLNAGPNNGGWQHIPAAPGIGGAANLAELQVDLNVSQNIPQLFNTAAVRADTYKVAEIKFDPNIPGALVPNCPNAPAVPAGGFNSDGCITYPIQITNGPTISVPITLVAPGNGKLTPIVIGLTMTITAAPTSPGAPYMVTVDASAPANPSLGAITGSVDIQTNSSPSSTPSSTKVRKLAVTAYAIGTSTPIATSQVRSSGCPSGEKLCYTLELPAAGGPDPNMQFGTLYDLALAGGSDSYQAARMPPLYPGQSLTQNFTPTGSVTLGDITGAVGDGCVAGKPVIGATLQLLIPPDSMSSPPAGFCLTSPDQCVTIAVANTDNVGDFPLPGTVTVPAEFDNVVQAPGDGFYVLEVSAPGYQTVILRAKPGNGINKKGGGTCSTDPTGTSFSACNIQMPTSYITGGIPIIPPPSGQTTLVQVMAEDHGTNNVESSLPAPVTVTSTSSTVVPFTLNVPPATVSAFDLFTSTIDLYQGVVDPYQGHSIVAVSDVPAPAACATTTLTAPADPTPEQTIECVGHGSITGQPVANADLGTSVILETLDPDPPAGDDTAEVQLLSSIVRNVPDVDNTTPTSNYGFCAPANPGPYQVQRYELPSSVASVTPSAAPSPVPAGDPVSVTIPPPPFAGGPSPTPTPAIKCPTTCSNPDGTCPGICLTVQQPL